MNRPTTPFWVSLPLIAVAFACTIYFVAKQTNSAGPMQSVDPLHGVKMFVASIPPIAIMFGPYVVMLAAAWATRLHYNASLTVMLVVLLLCSLGVYCHWALYQEFLARPPGQPAGMNFGPFLLGIAQGFIAVCVIMGTIPWHRYRMAPRNTVPPDNAVL